VTADNLSNAFAPGTTNGANSTEAVGTTVFNNDAAISSAEVSHRVRLPNSVIQHSSDGLSQSLVDFLKKPIVVTTGNLTSTDTVSSFTGVDFPKFYNTIPLYKEKFRGNYGVRMDLVFRLVVNASRFQMGRYMLLWNPIGGADSNLVNMTRSMFSHVFTLTQRSQMPHAEIDISCDTEVVFTVPWSSALNFVNVNNVINNGLTSSGMGTIQMYPYMPLSAVVGATTCGYTLWVHAENIELFGATIPQAGFSVSRKGKSISDAEREQIASKPISSILMKIKETADVISYVPLLSQYGTSVSWLTEKLAGAASSFGFAKPTNLEKNSKISRIVNGYIANVDGPDNSLPLALSYKNQVANMPALGPTDLDEMDFAFLVTIPSYINTVAWSSANVTNTVLYSNDVHMQSDLVSNTVNGDTFFSFAPFQFVAQHFKYWRGSVVYKLKFVRTEFHSGRLSVAFQPADVFNGTATIPDVTNAHWIHREIIDLRTGSEFTFVIPFISTQPYVETYNSIGKFSITILDPLIAPATVPSTIWMIMEKCMGPDAEFAVPNATSFMPAMGVVPQMGTPSNDVDNICDRRSAMLGNSQLHVSEGELSAMCIGEHIRSYRTLLKKPVLSSNFTAITAGKIYINLYPFSNDAMSVNGVTNTKPSVNPDLISMISSLYLYSRGGIRYKIVSENVANEMVQSVPFYSNGVTPTGTISTGTTTSINTASLNKYQAFYNSRYLSLAQDSHEIEMPNYWKTFARVYGMQWTNPSSVASNSAPLAKQDSITYCNVDEITNMKPLIYRSVADDFQLAYFLSVPPMVRYTSDAFYNSFT
jgi:hypothetical protein